MEFGKIITVDFSKKEGKIRPLSGLNAGPMLSACGKKLDLTDAYRDMKIPAVRLADVEPPYGQNQLVDIHCIFPDFSADPDDPTSYNFTETDKYVAAVRGAGAEPVLRFGESPDEYERKLFVKSPIDLEKWASVCVHTVMHYNEGFAGGYKWRLKCFEIWDLPELPSGFVGEAEEFFALYATTAKALKERFPRIKVGGFGSLGFSGLNRLDAPEIYKKSPSYTERFLAYQKTAGAPLDFFSWYCYADAPEEIALHAQYARNLLDNAGFKRTASTIAGFNIDKAGDTCYRGYSADLAASFVTAQKSGIDMMFYNDARPFGERNALYTTDGRETKFTAARSAFCAFGRLLELGCSVESLGDSRRELYSLAASDKGRAAVLVISREYSGKLEIRLRNPEFSAFSVRRFYDGEGGEPLERTKENISLCGNKIVVSVEEGDLYLFEFS